MKDLSIIVYVGDRFWSNYFLDLMCAFILIAVSIVFFLIWNQNRDERKNLCISALALFVLIVVLMSLFIPKSLDIKYLESPVAMDGVFNQVLVDKSKENDNLPKETKLKINNKDFKLRGSHPELRHFVGEKVTVYYLPNSNYVLKIELNLKKRGNSQ